METLQIGTFGATYLSNVNHIGLLKILLGDEPEAELLSEWPEVIPFPQFSSSIDGNSTIIYTYFQVNETTVAEITFDMDSGLWASSPTYLYTDVGS